MAIPKFKTTKSGGILGYEEATNRWVPVSVNSSGELVVDVDGATDATTPTIYNITLTASNTEYSQALPAGTRMYTFQNRNYNKLRWSFTTGKVATPTAPYSELKSGAAQSEIDVNLTSKTLYFASSTAGDIVDLLVWA